MPHMSAPDQKESSGSLPGYRRWLVLAGPVSSYTWDLLARISRRSGARMEVFHKPPEGRQIRTSFAHESFQSRDVVAHDWGDMTPGELVRAMDISKADAIFLFGTRSKVAMAEALVRRPRKCPLVFVGDTNVAGVLPSNVRGWLRLLFYRAIAPFVTEAWTLGRSNEQAFRLLGFRRFRTLPFYSVTYDDLGAPRTKALAVGDGPFKLLAIARLSPEKNIETLIRAIGDQTFRNRVALTIVGDGPSRTQIEDLIHSLQITNVRLLGAVPHSGLSQHLNDAHALVLPSRYEPWGNVITEALGMGIPVLATPEVGAATSSAGRYTGIRVADGFDELALQQGLHLVLEDYPLLATAAIEQAARVRAEFDVEHVAQRMVDAIDSLSATATSA